MQIKAWLKAGGVPLCAGLFAALAWGLAQWIPASARQTRWEKAAAELSITAPTAEVCVVAKVHFAVQLSAADVAVWRGLLQQGTSPETALRTVVTYARGRIEMEGLR